MKTENLTSLSAKLEVCPEATATDLLNDSSCLLATIVEQIRNMASDMAENDDPISPRSLSNSLYGTLYLAELAKSTLDAGHLRFGLKVHEAAQ